MRSFPSLHRSLLCALALLAAPSCALAAAPFDLEGPQLQVTVTRAGRTLPIAEAPDLAAGDRLSIKADLPRTQAAPYLLVAAFLRGATNPPPESWFFQSRTWDPKDRQGLTVTVPEGAQQMLVFLAPHTGGDFNTLRGAVRARPGAFVRAAQDLNQASLDHGRLMVFLSAVGAIAKRDPAALKSASPLLARSLAIKLDSDCLQKALELQAACLTQGDESLILADGHTTSMMQALTSGDSAELVQQLSATPKAGGGYFSPYVASVLDIAHLMNSFGTAQYQYIPALATVSGDRASLLLNAPPSFQNPKSVLVAALPAISAAPPPPLHVIDAQEPSCLEKPGLVLAVDGAPLVFSTAYAHDLVLRVDDKDGQPVDLPLRADPEKGGLALEAQAIDPAKFPQAVQGQVLGRWGFDPYTGPKALFESAASGGWRLAPDDRLGLIAGRKVTARLEGSAPACVDQVTMQAAGGSSRAVAWKPDGSDRLAVDLPLEQAQPGPLTLLVSRFGPSEADSVPLTVYPPASRVQAFTVHAGDGFGVLQGEGLEAVASLQLGGVAFTPQTAGPAGTGLALAAANPAAAAKLKSGQTLTAQVKLKDGRVLALPVTVAPARPAVRLMAKSVRDGSPASPKLAIVLGDPDELPHDGQLTFSFQAQGAVLTGSDKVEVATADGSASTRLTTASGGFTLQNAQVGIAMVDLGQAFGPSAFGPLRFRVVGEDGASDWQPLGVMVRLPSLDGIDCTPGEATCQLSGSDLFLLDQVADNARFAAADAVPAGFTGNTLATPRPRNGKLFIRLSDDPAATNTLKVAAARGRPKGLADQDR